MNGDVVTSTEDLLSGQFYVAVGAEVGGFRKMDYGLTKPVFNTSPHMRRRYVMWQIALCILGYFVARQRLLGVQLPLFNRYVSVTWLVV